MIDSVTNAPARVFCSYSHRDDDFRQELEAHLSPLMRQGLITFWYDRRIVPGDEWKQRIASQLDEADIILLLISAYFVNSDYCYRIELGRALQRHDEGSAVVIPIFVRACDWEGLEFARLQGLPPDAVPINDYHDRDKAWVLVTKGIRKALADVVSRRPQVTSRSSLSEASPAEANSYEVHAYLRHLVTSYEKELKAAHEIRLNGEIGGKVVPLDTGLNSWVEARSPRLLLLSGDAGSGKTWALRRLAATLAKRILKGDMNALLPLYVPFRSLQESDGLLAISRAIPEAHGILERSKKGVNTVILLDGIDEVPAHDVERGVRIMVDLLERSAEPTCLAVSCRTQFAPAVIARLGELAPRSLTCTIRELTAQQINEYLKQSGVIPAVAPSMIQVIRHPIMLRLFWETLSQSGITGSASIDDIYGTAISASLKAAQERDRRLAAVPREQLLSVMTRLTGQMFPRLTVSMGDMRIENAWSSRQLDIVNGLVAAGLLKLDTREFVSFAHVSLFEFFFARLLHEELSVWNASLLSASNLIYSYTVNRFLVPALLRDRHAELTPRGSRVRQRLAEQADKAGGSLVTRPVLVSDFIAFAEDTGWRRDTGFGLWLTFSAPDGTLASSDGTVGPEAGHIAVQKLSQGASAPAVSLSWYDAQQFARWVGGRLPLEAELRRTLVVAGPAMEWTSDWYDEEPALLRVISAEDGRSRGVNPDVRSSWIGFRVTLL